MSLSRRPGLAGRQPWLAQTEAVARELRRDARPNQQAARNTEQGPRTRLRNLADAIYERSSAMHVPAWLEIVTFFIGSWSGLAMLLYGLMLL